MTTCATSAEDSSPSSASGSSSGRAVISPVAWTIDGGSPRFDGSVPGLERASCWVTITGITEAGCDRDGGKPGGCGTLLGSRSCGRPCWIGSPRGEVGVDMQSTPGRNFAAATWSLPPTSRRAKHELRCSAYCERPDRSGSVSPGARPPDCVHSNDRGSLKPHLCGSRERQACLGQGRSSHSKRRLALRGRPIDNAPVNPIRIRVDPPASDVRQVPSMVDHMTRDTIGQADVQ